jgi:hypothetical protein
MDRADLGREYAHLHWLYMLIFYSAPATKSYEPSRFPGENLMG